MSYGISAFAIDLGIFRHVFRSKDEKLVLLVQERFQDMNEPERRRALIDLVHDARNLDPRRAADYAYAFEALCDHFGDFLPNDKWLPISSSFFRDVDQALREAGVPPRSFTASHLQTRGCPFKLPPPPDFPAMGYLRTAEIKLVSAALAAGDYTAIRAQGHERTCIVEAIQQVRAWLRTCLKEQCDLMCFYH